MPRQMLIYDQFDSPLGRLTVVRSTRGVCYIGLPNTTLSKIEAHLRRRFPGSRLAPSEGPFTRERKQLRDFAEGRSEKLNMQLDHRNSPFALEALEAVRLVPYGTTATYGDIARRMGRRGASRAVGRAVAGNPLPLAIPCHRIVGSDGSLTGYGGGLPMKKVLLRLESRRP